MKQHRTARAGQWAGAGLRVGTRAVALAGVLMLASVTVASAGPNAKMLIERKGCLLCHSLNGKGGKMGPPLQSTPAWSPPERMKKYILDPKAVNPKSIMPKSRLSEAEVDAIVTYLQGYKKDAKAPKGWKPK